MKAAGGGGTREISERAFQAYGEPLDIVASFRYLGSLLTAGDDELPEVIGNLWKAKKSWMQMSRILGR